MERLRSSRAKLLEHYRRAGERPCGPRPGALLVPEVMEQEWLTLRAAEESPPEALAQVGTSCGAGAAPSSGRLPEAGVLSAALQPSLRSPGGLGVPLPQRAWGVVL